VLEKKIELQLRKKIHFLPPNAACLSSHDKTPDYFRGYYYNFTGEVTS